MSRRLYDLTFMHGDETIAVITAGVDLDDEEAADLTLATYATRAVRRAGGDRSDLADVEVRIRKHRVPRLLMVWATDQWIGEGRNDD